MALSQPGPRQAEEPAAHRRQQLQESTPSGPAEPRSPHQESSSPGPAEPRSPHQESLLSGPAEPRSPQQESLLSGPAERSSPPQELPPAGSAEPRSPPQESLLSGPPEPRSPPQESLLSGPPEPRSPPQELPPAGPAEPRSPQQESLPAGPAEPRSPPEESLLSGPAEPRSPPQESLPAGPAELRPSAAPGLGRQLRVVLTPLPAAAWPRPQKRLLSARSPAGKRLCLEPDSGPRAAPGSPPGPSSAARGQDCLWDADSDGSDAGDAAPDGYSHLSAYERKRLKNITENAKFFAALKLHESAARLNQLTTKRQSQVTKRPKPKKAEDEPALRRSMRLLRVEPPLDIPLLDTFSRPDAEEYPPVPVGPLPMLPESQVASSKRTEALLSTWMRISEVRANDAERGTPDLKRYQEILGSMVLREENIRKVVKSRVCSMAIHPSESTILVAAGDKFGHVGLWNVGCGTEEGAHMFIPHSFHVNCMHFSPCNPAHLLSLSNDTLRCGDVTKAVFDEICRSEEDLSCFDFLEENACTAVVSRWAGPVAVVDRRTPGVSSELSVDIGFRKTRTVHVHPVKKQYFLAAGSVDVCIFDVRYLRNAKENKPLSTLTGHTRSVASAYFSPVTGSRVVTVCADDHLRVYDTTSVSSTVTLLSSISHNNNTGRWLSRFRAIWDPKQEHCFLVGSLAQPRQIEVFQDTGKLLHSFCNVDCLNSVCSINVVHPSQNILVGGNSSGRLHVFK
ncbi:WD repeat-containing protein 76 isoform X2 [Pyrgilauda ruficollis]|uniref:WD repeat-containing protein 76 isoform X2 n=1 Tax=Pyrgilauda ruficollis TaxID=221976 RepID=UPI001B860AE1|nr:WD repeat-containing protein 76 isoform X2 [Pyrgilauda ruficollis]